MHDAVLPPDPTTVADLARRALAEDRAWHDVTTRATIPPDQQGHGAFLVKTDGVICGMDVVAAVFAAMSPAIELDVLAADGSSVEAGHIAAEVRGPLAPLLSAERVALNFLQRLSGIATLTRRFVDRAAEGGPAQIVDTRKTTPGLRDLERYAVRVGGARNHRNTLEDGVLIKDNHIAAALKRGISVDELVREARMSAPHTLRIELEVTDVATALLAVAAGVDVILLDNMTPDQLRTAVQSLGGDGRVLEASGGVNLDNVREIAATGVHLISVGRITHSAPALDISLEIAAQ
ncbi:MAG: carboxylating nicotinate-nucleotide diphosphorylase [Chloroflexi bacterium]|nr:carboxylating nicotinate-nucleotide diphosphorylase [Chloroflexota bacterium]